jgi:hypothetical protein
MCEKRSFQVSKFESVDFTIKSCVTCVFAFSSLHESVDFGTVCTKIQKFEYFRQILCSHLCLFVGMGERLTLCLRQQAETDTKQRPRGSGSDGDGTPLLFFFVSIIFELLVEIVFLYRMGYAFTTMFLILYALRSCTVFLEPGTQMNILRSTSTSSYAF